MRLFRTASLSLTIGGSVKIADLFLAAVKPTATNSLIHHGLCSTPSFRCLSELADTRLEFGWGGTLAITRNRMPDMGVKQGVVYYAQGFSSRRAHRNYGRKAHGSSILDSCEDFDLMAGLKTISFPGGPLLRRPSL